MEYTENDFKRSPYTGELLDINYFRNRFKIRVGEPDRKIEAPKEVIEKYKDILPEELLYYWEAYGFSSFNDGLLWFTNPDDYEELIDEYLKGTQFENRKDLYIIARSAFGRVFVWESKKGNTFILFSLLNMITFHADTDRKNLNLKEENIEINKQMSFSPQYLDEEDANDKPLFERCLKKFGKLEADEMYGYKLSHFLGGAESIKNIEKVNIFNHYSIQKQLKEPHLVISDIENNTLMY
ncbi:GAD-like domain-containing protein [Campylobacterota bacterium DY0563]